MPETSNRRAWLVYACAAFAYVIAVLQRSSFGVAGLAAQQRFDAPATVLSMFVVLQLLVYAALQVPAGLLADRYGSRVVIGTGALIMALGQLDLAFAASVPSAVVARILVGAGDALTFTCVIKLLPAWFSSRQLPMITQVTSLLGQLGQLGSTIGIATLLAVDGWTTAFGTAAALGALAAAVVFLGVKNRPVATRHQALAEDLAAEGFLERAREVFREPGTRLGFWIHALAGFPGLVFAMMWGYPYLLRGEGLSTASATAMFSVFVACSMVVGPVMGWLVMRHPLRLSNLALGSQPSMPSPWQRCCCGPGQRPFRYWWPGWSPWRPPGRALRSASNTPGTSI